ncbi:MAG: aryl-sulfate sulfohydrolase [Pirellulaceae bacterium]|nr:MAG: aryl-sulfate sulfohydrolase [Pirellulaceae bacterium]
MWTWSDWNVEGRRSTFLGPWLALCLAMANVCFLAEARLAGDEPQGRASQQAPNVVLIVADDLGWTDLGCQGSLFYETPRIDRMAEQGMRFERFYACPNCQPTRAALMSGQYGPRTGVYTVGSIDRFNWRSRPLRPVDNVQQLPLEKLTLGQLMQQAGYATGYFGKWHLGQQGPYHPSQRGFDEAITSMGRHFDFATQPRVEYPSGTYLADWLTDRAVDFIQRHKEERFFLIVAHFAVHTPLQARPDDVEPFRKKMPSGGHRNPVYAGMIASLDRSVGRILDKLDELNLSEKTAVIFTSDNGGVGGYRREGIDAQDITDNSPLRCGKGSLYEGGIRVPFIVRWPGVVPARTSCAVPAIHVDLLPTLAELSGAKVPADYTLDGTSLLPLWKNPNARWSRPAVFQHFPGYLGANNDTWRTTPAGAIITQEWKLIEFFEDGRLELYRLTTDPGETTNLAGEHPQQVQKMLEQLREWRTKIGAPMPTRGTASP